MKRSTFVLLFTILVCGLVFALGSLYVMEGSTLGGAVITKALRHAAWLPPGGFRYFNPYGAETGRMWRRFQDAFRAACAVGGETAVERGAVETFEVLHRWLTPL